MLSAVEFQTTYTVPARGPEETSVATTGFDDMQRLGWAGMRARAE
jgi:hypothetical protein